MPQALSARVYLHSGRIYDGHKIVSILHGGELLNFELLSQLKSMVRLEYHYRR